MPEHRNSTDPLGLVYCSPAMPIQRVYLETTIASYLAARSTRDLIAPARQELTHEG